MENIIKKMYRDKKEYRQQMARVQALPEDYRFVFEKMSSYLWSFAGGDGHDMLKTQQSLLELFEAGAAQGKPVLSITGENVAGFCEELARGNRLWTDRPRRKLNQSMRDRHQA